MKSFRKIGISISERTATRSAIEPPKRRCSVSTLTTAAPASSYCAASLRGSEISASDPLLGDERFTSAITVIGAARSLEWASITLGA